MDRAREAAAKILLAVHEENAYANVVLAREIRKLRLEDRDRRFVTEIVYGTTKAGMTLDWILQRYINRPLKKISPMVREILRTGMYQIFYMEKVPPSAACNEAVELAKKYSHIGTVKFVNAVLRTAARQPEKAAFPIGKKAEYLALSAFHPVWLVKKWIAQFGYEETTELCAFNNGQPNLSLRANTLKCSQKELLDKLCTEGAEGTASEWTPEGVLCQAHGSLDMMEALQQGFCQVQDESSMLVAHVVDPQPGEFIIDACSAPGGKATHMAALMKNQGRILAGDIYPHKLARIEENARRLSIEIIETVLLDARKIGENFTEQADRVLADVPCSGLGVLRRKPDARWKKQPSELEELPLLQFEILESASKAVKKGGILVYSTCTIVPEENQQVVEKFLKKHKEFLLENTGEFLPLKHREEKMVQLYPHKDGTDGFFIVRMKRMV